MKEYRIKNKLFGEKSIEKDKNDLDLIIKFQSNKNIFI